MDTITRTYTVEGMTCGHCVRAVSDEVGALDGVRSVQVDLEAGSMTVTSEDIVADEDIAAAVDEAGYLVVA